ncbi:uncharacterized protein LOC131890653 [Tigriopus californicus]|uniref:uncharacterized protein LOC131890653 n=1 Tax=Tigriopus californicus TaxID=6832 RepID=UPI0027DA5D30|nr:uncharacterized protein LOC131890653 [Tigriopus californicus]
MDSSSVLKLSLLIIGFIVAWAKDTQSAKREPKLLSLFNIVQFKQGPCVQASDTSKRGICMTTQQCTDRSGAASGNCAAGFGVCCGFTASTCGSTIKENCTYVSNPNFPSAATPGMCEYTINRICDDLCQVRLDFDNFQTSSPPGQGAAAMQFGDCSISGDTFTATSPIGVSPPVVCGTLSGQHMFVETGTSGDAAKISFTIASSAATYQIKVTYYQCSSLNKAPANCVQYLTGVSGSFQSYNFQGMVVNDNQNYLTCMRQERGYCSIQYSANAFNLLGSTAGTPEEDSETGTVEIKPRKPRFRPVRTRQLVNKVRNKLIRNPHRSLGDMSKEYEIPKTTLRRVLKFDLKKTCFKFTRRQVLSEATGRKTPLVVIPEGTKVNSDAYINLLEEELLPWIQQQHWEHGYAFMQDGAPAHTSKKTQDWCKANLMDFWDKNTWPPSSPDLNPMDFSI